MTLPSLTNKSDILNITQYNCNKLTVQNLQQLPCFKLLNYTKLKKRSEKKQKTKTKNTNKKKKKDNVQETIDYLSNKGKRVVHLVWNFCKVLFATAAALYTSSFSFNNAIKAGNVGDLESILLLKM